jgi:hypothetical protein
VKLIVTASQSQKCAVSRFDAKADHYEPMGVESAVTAHSPTASTISRRAVAIHKGNITKSQPALPSPSLPVDSGCLLLR